MLVARDVGHRFADRWLYRNISLQLDPGSVTVVVGPSGSGKSTLLAILGGLLAPTTGAVVRSPPDPSHIAWVLQGTNNLPARTVIDNAGLLARLDGASSVVASEHADRALEAIDLHTRRRARARSLSGGENQRLCIARALACRRPMLFADEPTSHLDRTNAHRAMTALCGQADQGRVVLVVTHDLEAIPTRANILNVGEGGLTRSPSAHHERDAPS